MRKDELICKLREEEIIDSVEIDGVEWIEISEEKGVGYVQPSIERRFGKNNIPLEACLEETND
jgi:hypothetical protein